VKQIFFYLSYKKMAVRIVQGDPNAYAFRHLIPAPDTDPSTIRPVVTIIGDDESNAAKFCDAEQLDAQGNYRLPKALRAARAAGYTSSYAKYVDDTKAADAAKKAADDAKQAADEALKSELIKTKQEFDEYKRVTEARFDKVAALLSTLAASTGN
jgi:hypothetical protein